MELQRGTLIYYNSNTFISVYQGLLGSTPVAIKELCFTTLDAANSAVREAMIQAQLDHPHICRVYDCRLEECQGWVKVVLVLEWLEGGDVWKEIERRAADRQGWTGEELERHAKGLVDALAYAQTRGVSHRDIKPQNIYLTGDKGTLKLGDFGSSKRSFSPELTSTLHGTPAFLSPELRKQYVSVLMNGGQSLRHDESKADVYSLGITLVCMGLLGYPQEEIGAGEAALNQVVERLGLSGVITTAIKQMLSNDALKRPTFEELTRLLNQPKSVVNLDTCVHCNLSLQRSTLVCSPMILLSCGHPMHESCCYSYLETSFRCQGELQVKCPECKQGLSLEGLRASEQWQQLLKRVQHECAYCRKTTLKGAQCLCEHWICLDCLSKSSECMKCQEYENLMLSSSG